MNSDTLTFSAELILAGAVILFVILILYGLYKLMTAKKPISGIFKVNDNDYPYTLSDNFSSYYGMIGMHGISVTLPKNLPNMVFDAHYNNKLRGMPYKIDESQHLKLEGKFNDNFAFYTPTSDTSTALSIITPDIMERLLAGSYLFDIEIVNNKMMIFSRAKMMNNQVLQQKLLDFTQILLNNIDHRFQSWSDQDDRNAKASMLNMIFDEQIKIGRHYAMRQSILFLYIFDLFIAAFFIWLSRFYAKSPDLTGANHRISHYSVAFALFLFPLFPAMLSVGEVILSRIKYKKIQADKNRNI